jgi:hypothetical protein
VADGIRLELGPGLWVEWRLEALMRAADAADPSASPLWSCGFEPASAQSLRLISLAATQDAFAFAVARPPGAAHHDEDLVAGVSVGASGVEVAEEVLISSEYDPEGELRRVGIELWLEGGAGRRIAGDRSAQTAVTTLDGLSREATPFAFRLDGGSGSGLHELLLPAS